MARAWFGGTSADGVFGIYALGSRQLLELTRTTLRFYDTETGGTQYVDLLDKNGAATSSIVTDLGHVPAFQGPDGVTEMWADDGDSQRHLMVAQGRQGPEGPQGPPGPQGQMATGAAEDDAAIAGFAGTPGSATNDVLSATYAPQADKGERFVTALDQRTDATVVVLGDSTGTPTYGTTWPQRLGTAWATDYPNALINYRMWTAGTYASPVEIADGEANVVVLSDTFARTASNLYGTTPDVGGGTWTASNPNTYYNLSGNGAATLASNAIVATKAPLTVAGGYQTTTWNFTVITTNSGNIKLLSSLVSGNGATFQITVNVSTNIVEFHVYDAVTDVTVNAPTFAAAGITGATGTPQTVAASVAHNPNGTVTFTCGSASYTHTLTGTQNTLFATADLAGFYGSSAGHTILDITTTRYAPAATTLDIYNGSVGSTNAVDTLTSLAARLPVEPDVVVISHSHNHLTDTPTQFEVKLDNLVAGIRGLYADTPIVISGQNPQYAPTANPAQHNTRQRDLRRYARVRGFGYVPVFEAYMAQANPQAYIDADGVHPTDSGTDGLQLWADTAHGYFDALSLRPA